MKKGTGSTGVIQNKLNEAQGLGSKYSTAKWYVERQVQERIKTNTSNAKASLSNDNEMMQTTPLAHEIETLEEDIQEREKQINKISEDVIAIHSLFGEINRLTHQQSPILENIEKNLENAALRTKQATEELKKAEESSPSWCLLS